MPVLTLPNPDSRSLTVRAKALLFEDPRSQALLRRIHQVAPSDATVLVIGETGTGKEIVARHLHERSARADQPFVAVNCGAFSESLVESELFGHDKGAFTGAQGAKAGWFEAAHGGTLFLDEIGDLTPAVQVKLLRVLQEREVVRIGSRQPIPIDVRLIAATNVNLDQAVAAGRFREDLYYRLKVAVLALPPLRERTGDILPLAHYFLDLYRQRLQTSATALTDEAARTLLAHSWPGNIRELENVVHSALLVSSGDRITVEALNIGIPIERAVARAPEATAAFTTFERPQPPAGDPAAALQQALVRLFEENLPELHTKVEETLVRAAFTYCHRNQLQTARLLGISRNVVRARLMDIGEIPISTRTAGADHRSDADPALPRAS